jgi:diacylglycerol kinase family enzyme
VLPCGTGNLLARNLGMPMRVEDAVAVATANGRRVLDVGEVDGQCFLIMAGMGFDAHMLHDAPAELKARIGWPAYGWAAMRHLCATPMTVHISIDHGPSFNRRARAILVGNVGRLQGGIRLLPAAVPDDGRFDVAVLMPPRRRNWMALAWALLRQRRTPPSLEVFQAQHVDIVSDQVQPRELDGDLIAPSATMTVALRPGALVLCVPETAVRTAAPEPMSVADGPR